MDKELEKQLALRKLHLTKLGLKTTLTRRKSKNGALVYKQVVNRIGSLKADDPLFQK